LTKQRSPNGRKGSARRLSVLAAMAGLLWLVSPVPVASAHAYLLASAPPSGYAVPTPPAAVGLDFDLPVTIGTDPLALIDAAGAAHDLGRTELSLSGRRLSAPLSSPLPDGGYRLRWEVTADDGDVVSGIITFTVGAGSVASDRGANGAAIDSPVVVFARWAVFAALALALGGLVGDRLVRRVLRDVDVDSAQAAGPRPAILAGAILGVGAASTLAVAQVGPDLARLVGTGPGRIVSVEALGFGAATVPALLARHRRSARLDAAAAAALLAVVAAEGMRAHPHAESPMWGTALTIAHLLAATVWIGTLLHVLRAARQWRGQPGWTRLLVHDYSRLALIGVAVVLATGTAEALIVLPSPSALITTSYGLILLAKIALVTAIVVLAGLGRRRLRTTIRRHAVSPIGRSATIEAAALIGVLAVTAVLVSVAPAGPVNAALPAPPAPNGPVVTVGTLAGQLTVIGDASAGRLVIRMTSPGRDDLGTDDTVPGDSAMPTGSAVDRGSGPANYQLSAQLSSPGAATTALAVRGCGPGCFTAPVSWLPGINRVRLAITAPPWSGGEATLDVPWPPRSDPTLLPSVLAAMRAVTHMTVHQAVTSNYTGYPGDETPLIISGPEFLGTEPYGTGGGDPVILASRPEETEVGLGFPTGIVVRLFIGADHRILREEQTAPNHLITSTFEYPPSDRG
jgi:copper transport protein